MKIKLRTLLLTILLLGLSGFVLVLAATSVTLTPTNPANFTNYSVTNVVPTLSASPAANAVSCNFTVTYSNTTASDATAMANTSLSVWSNASAYTPILDNTYDTWHNITFTCYNASGDAEGSSFMRFGYDTTNPTIDSISENVYNTSSGGGHYINLTFNTTDVHNYNCKAYISDPDNNLVSAVSGSFLDDVVEDIRCRVVIPTSTFTGNGNYTITPWSNDTLGNSAFGTNQTYTAYQLKTGWNHIEIPENLTLGAIGGLAENITIVSDYDNEAKTYTTYTIGVATNRAHLSNSTNPVYVYVNDDVVVLREHRTDTHHQNTTMYLSGTDGWNHMGMMYEHTLNETFYLADEGGFATWIYNSTGDNVTTANSTVISSVSWYNATLGKHCTAIRGFDYTSCSPQFNVTDVSVKRGQGVWVLVSGNISYDRGAT